MLERALDEHEALIRACVRGELRVPEFLAAYDGFYVRWPLDGHEGRRALLEPFERRIEVHRRIWDEIECRITTEAFTGDPAAREKGFIGEREARDRLETIAREGGLLEPR